MKLLRLLWHYVAEVMGEGDYARYCEQLRARHPEMPLPTAGEFYQARLVEKYSRPNRCC